MLLLGTGNSSTVGVHMPLGDSLLIGMSTIKIVTKTLPLVLRTT